METILQVPEEQFCPRDVFESGQTFRFQRTQTGYRGIVQRGIIETTDCGDSVLIKSSLEAGKLREYLDLDRAYDALFPDADPVLRQAIKNAPGLRVLCQEPFETLISFIISANNNIPRITLIIDRLCEAAGDEFVSAGKRYRAFPSPSQLSRLSEERLRELGCGYRAPYIAATCRMAGEMDLEGLRQRSYEEAKKTLLTFPGVGSKVADCICLFSLGQAQAFPVDVWIERILRLLYGFEGNRRQMETFARERFGPAAGIAQQYLFHYARQSLPKGK